MSGPYLESGESIVLTTDRVGLDQTVYTAMLTNRQLILIDSRHDLNEPRSISLATVFSVRSGNAATLEPVISITCERPDGKETTTHILHFLQGPLENRKHDRDLWVKKIIEHSLSGRAVEEPEEPEPAARVDHKGFRRRDGPEISRPRIENFPSKVPSPNAGVTLEETEHRIQPEISQNVAEPQEKPGPVWPVLAMQDTGDLDTGEHHRIAPEPDRPANDGILSSPAPQEGEGPRAGGSLTASILRAVQSLTARPPARGAERENVVPCETLMAGESPIRRTTSLPEHVPEPLKTDGGEKTPTAFSGTPHQDIVPDVTAGSEQTSGVGVIPPSQPDKPGAEEKNADHDVGSLPEPEPETDTIADPGDPHEEPAGTVDPGTKPVPIPVLHQTGSPPSGTPQGTRHPLITGAIILLIVLGIAAVLVLPAIQLHEPPAIPVKTPTPAPTITSTPDPTDTTTPTPTETPSPPPTPEVTTVFPTPARSEVPQTGVWIRVMSSAAYTGQAGNPGYLRQFSGPGEKFISTYRPEGLVEVSVQKHDFTDAELLVEVFNNGVLILSRSTTIPRGSVELLINPQTGSPPGLPPVTPTTAPTTSPHIEYF